MRSLTERFRSRLDGTLRSQDIELLETEGATSQGIRIIDQLNRVYDRTGVLQQTARLITDTLQSIPRPAGQSLRVLEMGMRDGSLLRRVSQRSEELGLPVELHGVEFRRNLAELAQSRQQQNSRAIAFHVAKSPRLAGFPDRRFDLVYSLFSLHHFDPAQVEDLLQAGQRISLGGCIHVDLDRSVLGVAALWCLYTVLGCRQARHDSVLSVRRAYRRDEISAILKSLQLPGEVHSDRRFPLSWILRVETQETPAKRP